ncbi:MAG: ABC transporter permease subunit [Fimbriimonadaceae bacterium]|nr:hypothetical protein [Fimbriimonadaceae bacterium]MCC6351787.1 ABC transporter permease subunit [Fimbriimonadaceae bacterium]
MASSPIADLSYRDYTGPLSSPVGRWWVIARVSFQQNLKKKSLWWLTVMSGGYYFVFQAVVFFMEQFALSSSRGEETLREFLSRIVWIDQFVHGISTGQLWFFMIVLLVGAGSISNDFRANALLVYLSKPCDKRDYLLGKWFGMFLTLILAMGLPSVFFYVYGALTYGDYGFFSDKWLLPKLLSFLVLSSAFHASMMIGISSMFKQGRVAGAVYAALYFLTNFFTQMMVFTWVASQGHRGRGAADIVPLVKKLYYASVDGQHIGLAKAVLGTDGTPYFGFPSPIQTVPAPPLWWSLAVITPLSLLMLWVAWTRIRAVEVVK